MNRSPGSRKDCAARREDTRRRRLRVWLCPLLVCVTASLLAASEGAASPELELDLTGQWTYQQIVLHMGRQIPAAAGYYRFQQSGPNEWRFVTFTAIGVQDASGTASIVGSQVEIEGVIAGFGHFEALLGHDPESGRLSGTLTYANGNMVQLVLSR